MRSVGCVYTWAGEGATDVRVDGFLYHTFRSLHFTMGI
jgi:hypothetical protein